MIHMKVQITKKVKIMNIMIKIIIKTKKISLKKIIKFIIIIIIMINIIMLKRSSEINIIIKNIKINITIK
jgi:hypothetical protein